jgi:formylglycine-generating enzyme required for sulfatase activity
VIGVKAVARLGVRPSGYVTGLVADAACAAAGKRLCQEDELVTACRGEEDTLFPYGPSFVDGQCNVFREAHPASILHGNPSLGHIDPRLNRVAGPKGPLLRLTGETLTCRSRWGEDAIYDLVGNLDEWIDHPTGAFVGGFYSRSTRAGCEAKVAAHPKAYADYSTGIRCCRDAGAR